MKHREYYGYRRINRLAIPMQYVSVKISCVSKKPRVFPRLDGHGIAPARRMESVWPWSASCSWVFAIHQTTSLCYWYTICFWNIEGSWFWFTVNLHMYIFTFILKVLSFFSFLRSHVKGHKSCRIHLISPFFLSSHGRPTRQMPNGSWFPGGIGLHGCPGIPFAMLISKVDLEMRSVR